MGQHDSPELIEADIARQRQEVAETVAALQARLDVKARMKDRTAQLRGRTHELGDEFRHRATTDNGRPRPEVLAAAAVGTTAVGATVLARNHHLGGNMMHKLTALAAGGVGYVLGARAGRARYEQMRSQARHFTENPRVQNTVHKAEDKVRQHAPVVKDKVSTVTNAAAAKMPFGGERGNHAAETTTGTTTGTGPTTATGTTGVTDPAEGTTGWPAESGTDWQGNPKPSY